MAAHVGLGPSSLLLRQQPGCFPRLLRAATSHNRSHQHGFRLLYLTGHFEPRSVDQSRHGQAQHARLPSSLLLLPAHSGRLAVSPPLRGAPASSVTAHCRGATSTAVFATGYTLRSVGPAHHVHTLLEHRADRRVRLSCVFGDSLYRVCEVQRSACQYAPWRQLRSAFTGTLTTGTKVQYSDN